MKRLLTAAAAALLGALCIGTLHAGAYTADDLADKARANGWPESYVQQGYHIWTSQDYSQAQLDEAYDSITSFDKETADAVFRALGVRPPAEDADLTRPDLVEKADGTTEARISEADFIKLSFAEKQAYVDSLSEAERERFLATLSPEEQKSLLKQLPAEDKAELVGNLTKTADAMGIHIAVDGIGNGDLTVIVRDDTGKVIDQSKLISKIDNTGISHTLPLLTALLSGGAALCGLWMLERYNRGN